MPFSLLRLRANLIKTRGCRISRVCPSFPIFLPEDRILQEIGITGITPFREFGSKPAKSVATSSKAWLFRKNLEQQTIEPRGHLVLWRRRKTHPHPVVDFLRQLQRIVLPVIG
jgi:hypothetical protein